MTLRRAAVENTLAPLLCRRRKTLALPAVVVPPSKTLALVVLYSAIVPPSPDARTSTRCVPPSNARTIRCRRRPPRPPCPALVVEASLAKLPPLTVAYYPCIGTW